jgi:RNA polymerase sigma-70 factor (ECF subfamily)
MDGVELRDQLEKHHREAYGWALMCCSRNPADAENVLQTTYLKILEGRARFDGHSTFKTWLFAVIRTTAIDYRRREMLRRLRLVQHYETSAQVSERRRFDEDVYRTEIQTMFRHALSGLPRRQQQVLQLVFSHDLSLAEAAQVLGISVGSARTHYERGKKQLRHSMAQLGVSDESEFGRAKNQTVVP